MTCTVSQLLWSAGTSGSISWEMFGAIEIDAIARKPSGAAMTPSARLR